MCHGLANDRSRLGSSCLADRGSSHWRLPSRSGLALRTWRGGSGTLGDAQLQVIKRQYFLARLIGSYLIRWITTNVSDLGSHPDVADRGHVIDVTMVTVWGRSASTERYTWFARSYFFYW